MLLNDTDEIIRVITDAAVDVDVYAVFADQTASAFAPDSTPTKIATATTTTVVAAPAASTQRQVKLLVVRNTDASSQVGVTIEFYDGATAVQLWRGVLAALESVQFTWDAGFQRIDANGSVASSRVEAVASMVTMDDVIAEGVL
jgi:hypothetical protein